MAGDLPTLTASLAGTDGTAQRNLWLVRLTEWLRHGDGSASDGVADDPPARLHRLLDACDRQPALRTQLQQLVGAFWRDMDTPSLFADFGFGTRLSLHSDLAARLRRRWLPGTPDTADLAQLFQLLFDPVDADWMARLDAPTLARAADLLTAPGFDWQAVLLESITILASAVHASGYSPALRQRMERGLLVDEPFRQITMCSNALRAALADGRHEDVLPRVTLLRTVLDACRRAAASVGDHLEAFGVSVDIVYEVDQLDARTRRIDLLLDSLLAADRRREGLRLLVHLLQVSAQQQGLRAMVARHYSLLARQVAERNAEAGEHYITRDRAEYGAMLRMALGGGAVIAGTTFAKFAILAIGLSAFWSGFWAGTNYAVSFVVVMLLHWTVATKQPAMTAPALADSLPRGDGAADADIEAFVDRVAQLIRSQIAGIVGNLVACGPLVLLVQWAVQAATGQPLVGTAPSIYVLQSLHLLGPTALYAAFTGVLLFASSLVAGWAENWFVFHRLDSAIAWNPRIVARLGSERAARWAAWWRGHVSGIAANVSLGLMLGVLPAVLNFLGLPLDVRHVTLATGQLAAALGALGLQAWHDPVFWWCVASIPVIGALNLGVSFYLAFRVALRSRDITVRERHRVSAALWRRWRTDPLGFLRPPR